MGQALPTNLLNTKNSFTIHYGKRITVKAIAYQDGRAAGEIVSNTYSVKDKLANVVFTPEAGTYEVFKASTMPVELHAADGAEIHYTLDNKNPTVSSTKYRSPISIGTGVNVIKAIAVKNGMVTSDVATSVYVIDFILEPIIPDPFVTLSTTVTEKTQKLSGTVSKNCKVTVKVGSKKYSTTSGTGKWSLRISKPKVGTKVSAVATIEYLTSRSVSKIVRPSAPAVNKITNKSKSIAGKTAFAKVKVTIKIGKNTYKINSTNKTYKLKLKKSLKKKTKVIVYYSYTKVKSIETARTVA